LRRLGRVGQAKFGHGLHGRYIVERNEVEQAAIIGLATGLRQFPLAVGVTVLTLIALRGLLLVERKIRREMPRPPSKELS